MTKERALVYWREMSKPHYRRISGQRYMTWGYQDTEETLKSKRVKEKIEDYKKHYKSVRILKNADGTFQIYHRGLKEE